jgi:rhodanese-related sulfurtransferase
VRDHFQEFEISPELVREIIDGGEEALILLDVRDDWEWERAHIESAIHIPLDQLSGRIEDLDRNQEIVAYCHVGERSIDACLVLWDAGFRKIRSMIGGIEAWSELVDPTVPRY